MEKTYLSRTNISEDVLLLMARVSILTKQLNGLTLTDQPKKQKIINELFGSVGTNPFVGDNFHCDFGNKGCATSFSAYGKNRTYMDFWRKSVPN